jgi:hypothetical protein
MCALCIWLQACGLFMFPTKALAQDQLRVLRQLMADAFGADAPCVEVSGYKVVIMGPQRVTKLLYNDTLGCCSGSVWHRSCRPAPTRLIDARHVRAAHVHANSLAQHD